MIITVAIATHNGGKGFKECLDALTHQRIINADCIRIYDSGSTDNTIEIAKSYGAEIRPITIDSKGFNHLETFKEIVNDNLESDILIHLAQTAIIEASAISELFRLFLKYDDLGMVYGRQMAPQEENLLTRFCYGFFFPITLPDYPVWHIMRVFSSFKMVAYRTKYLTLPKVIPVRKFYSFGDVYISARMAQKGLRIMYNPFAMCRYAKKVTFKNVYFFSKHLAMFLAENPWITSRWNIRTSEHEYFCEELKNYLKLYSSIPLISIQSYLVHLCSWLGGRSAKKEKLRIEQQLSQDESNE
jgi:glycosyltransferase involved in cell wall biosynthesis